MIKIAHMNTNTITNIIIIKLTIRHKGNLLLLLCLTQMIREGKQMIRKSKKMVISFIQDLLLQNRPFTSKMLISVNQMISVMMHKKITMWPDILMIFQ